MTVRVELPPGWQATEPGSPSPAIHHLDRLEPGSTHVWTLRLRAQAAAGIADFSGITAQASEVPEVRARSAFVSVNEPPAENDMFSKRTTIAGFQGSLALNLKGAGAEPGEPPHAGSAAQTSLWWDWTAPGDGRMVVAVEGGLRVGLYTGAVLSDLIAATPVNDGSRRRFNVQGGVTYHMAVDRNGGPGTGTLVFFLEPRQGHLSQPMFLTGDRLQFDFQGWNELTYQLETSRNLIQWVPIATNQFPTTPGQFFLPRPAATGATFWRTRPVP